MWSCARQLAGPSLIDPCKCICAAYAFTPQSVADAPPRHATLVPVVTAERLDCAAQRSIVPTQPFHFDGTFFNPSHFPSADQRWEPGRYWQTMRLGGSTY